MNTTPSSQFGGRERAAQALADGRFEEARRLYEALCAGPDAEARDFASLGMVHGSLGNPAAAEDACRRALALDPECVEAHCNLGVVAEMRGDRPAAADHYRAALALDPDNPHLLYNLAQILHTLEDLAGARQWYERALERAPRSPTLHLGLGLTLDRQGDADGARRHYQASLALRSTAEAHVSLGNLDLAAGQPAEARRHYERALALEPSHARALNNLGQLLAAAGETARAQRCFEAAIRAAPRNASALGNLAELLLARNDIAGAAARLEQALALEPDSVVNRCRLGNAWRRLKRHEEAAEQYRASLALDPRASEAHIGLGLIFLAARRHDWAVEAFRNALAIDPDHPVALNNLGVSLQVRGDTAEALDCYRRIVERDPEDAPIWRNLLFNLNYHPQLAPQAICEEHRRWGATLGYARDELGAPQNARVPGRRLRVGYVTPDLAGHSVAHFLEPVFSRHDRENFDIRLYAEVVRPRSDALNDRIRGLATEWIDTRELDDRALARRIRDDGIDLLIDLGGHTGASRVLAFAWRPAPVQIAWLGYCNTTGLPAMDYRLTDEWADPPEHAAFHTEELVRLPGGFLCYQPPDDAPEVSPPPAARAGHVTFGSFNILEKTNREVIALWARVLGAIPGSRLILKNRSWDREHEDSASRDRYREWFAGHGIEPGRVEFTGWLPEKSDHLELYSRIDIGLDPFPYNGTTTTCEALWMGVPVITLAGQRHAARVGTSLMTRVGLPECIGRDPDEYVVRAVALAGDRPRLAELRQSLRSRLCASTLGDATTFTRQLEDTYRALWRRWCERGPAA